MEGKQANTSLEMEEMLRRKSCVLNDDDQYYKLPPAESAHTRIPEHAVEQAICS